MAQLQKMMQNASNAGRQRGQGSGSDMPLMRGVNAANQIIQSGRDLRRDKMMHKPHKSFGEGIDTGSGDEIGGFQGNGFGGIEANENGVFGMSPANKFTFNEEDLIPSEQNGYHLGDYPKTEMYGHPEDFKRQMVANATGYGLGAFEPTQTKWFTPDSGTRWDNLFGSDGGFNLDNFDWFY